MRKNFFVKKNNELHYRCRPNSKSRFPNPKLFCASQMHKSQIICASQITYGIPNYLWHPKLLMASQITYGIPNYLWHPKLLMASQIV